MTNIDYPFHWLHPNADSRATGTHGDVLFSVRSIKAGDCVLTFGSHILTVEQESQLAGKLSDNGVQIAKNLVICSARTEECGGENFLNHSCEPNTGFKGQIAAARRAAHGLIDRSFCRTSFTALISANTTRQYGALLKQWGSL